MSSAVRFIARISTKRSTLAMMDQFFVSGTSLLTSILVGRYCGASGLGVFSLAISVIVMVRGFQETLVSSPYTVFRSRLRDRMTTEQHAGGALFGSMILGFTIFALLLIAAAVCWLTPSLQSASALVFALATAAPFCLLREFARRFEMASLNMIAATRIDAAVCVLQLALLSLLAFQNQLTTVRAVLVLGSVCGFVTIIWMIQRRASFHFRRHTIASTIRHDWGFGRWLITDQLLSFSQTYSMHWFLALTIGTAATGVFAACASIAAIASPILQGAGNYLAPKFAESVDRGSRSETIRLYWLATLPLVFALALLGVIAAVFAEQLLWLMYEDSSYSGYGMVVGILSLRLVCGIPGLAAHHGMVAMEAPGRVILSTCVGLMTTICFAIPLVRMYEIVGAAIAVSIGTGCESLALVLLFARSVQCWGWTEPSFVVRASLIQREEP